MVVDTYHVWWDAQLAADIARAGGGSSATSSATGWCRCPPDMLLGRGHLGDGSIDFRPISGSVLAAGYDGVRGGRDPEPGHLGRAAGQTAATVKERFADLLG